VERTPVLLEARRWSDADHQGRREAGGGEPSSAPDLSGRKGSHRFEKGIRTVLFLCAGISVLTTLAIVVVLLREGASFLSEVSLLDFLFGGHWAPLLEPQSFGVLPLVLGTFMVVVGAGLIAIPIGLCAGIYLSEYASPRMRTVMKPALEVLAGIPTVVYGYFALTFITPQVLRPLVPSVDVFNAASASIVVGIMILPMVASLCDDALRAVPPALRQGAYALGATSLEVSTRVTLPAALSGVVASFVLALSRAIGETMAVTLAAGATPMNLEKVDSVGSAVQVFNPFHGIQTMTAYIVQVSLGDTPAGGIEYKTIFAVASLLFLITLGFNVLANRVLQRFREIYE